MKLLLLAACACVQSFVLRPPLPQRAAALRAGDDERPPESDAEAERIAEMRARMEAMFGGGEAPAPEPPAPEPPVEGARQVQQVVLVDTRGGPVPCMVVPGGVRPIAVPPNTLQQMVAIRERRRDDLRATGAPVPLPPPPTILVPPGQAAPPGTVSIRRSG